MSRMNEEDREMLVELINKNKKILESKKSDVISIKQKNECWDLITKQFNARKTGSCKSCQQLKSTYKNMKAITRKNCSAKKKDIYQTGGGGASVSSEPNDVLLSLVEKSITPQINPFDSTAMYNLYFRR